MNLLPLLQTAPELRQRFRSSLDPSVSQELASNRYKLALVSTTSDAAHAAVYATRPWRHAPVPIAILNAIELANIDAWMTRYRRAR